jgi:hypothetical protein
MCSIPNAEHNRATLTSIFITDIFLLVVMFVGLIRMRRDGAGASVLGRLLWKQVRQWRALLGHVYLFPLMRFLSERASLGSCLQPWSSSRHSYVLQVSLYVSLPITILHRRYSFIWI